jgi:hypothetical protein
MTNPDERVGAGDPAGRDVALTVGGVEVGRYVHRPELEPYVSPRPYLHPVRTLGGVPVTDAAPVDHRWHLGVSVAIQDVGVDRLSTNFWGGRTYRHADGYQPRDDHGRVRQVHWQQELDGFRAVLEWVDRNGEVVLFEDRSVSAVPVGQDFWRLDVAYTLRNPGTELVVLGSPGTHGRADAGYGGYFWRLPPSAAALEVWSPAGRGEEAVHGRPAPWLAVTADAGAPGCGYTLVFLPGDAVTAADPWFVRVAAYPGVGSALAYTEPVTLAAGCALTRRVGALVADGRLSPSAVTVLLATAGSATAGEG